LHGAGANEDGANGGLKNFADTVHVVVVPVRGNYKLDGGHWVYSQGIQVMQRSRLFGSGVEAGVNNRPLPISEV
jgi:hypothetical protein